MSCSVVPVDYWTERWPSFSKREIYSPGSLGKHEHLLCPHAMDALQAFRLKLGVQIRVNHSGLLFRGLRLPYENSRVSGAAYSMHTTGRAFDIDSPDISLLELYAEARKFGTWKGVGLYRSWVHVDTRLSKESVIWTV